MNCTGVGAGTVGEDVCFGQSSSTEGIEGGDDGDVGSVDENKADAAGGGGGRPAAEDIWGGPGDVCVVICSDEQTYGSLEIIQGK